MQIRLAKDVAAFVAEQVRIGAAPSASDLVNATLRAMSSPRNKPLAVDAELEAWLLEAADSPAAPLRKADFDGIRRRVRARLAPAAS
jgi:Arc/MetJ-type ribon-helix-helix transcriptional regulator